jgi:hypothetical protein
VPQLFILFSFTPPPENFIVVSLLLVAENPLRKKGKKGKATRLFFFIFGGHSTNRQIASS